MNTVYRKHEQGIALIASLALLATIGLLAASAVAISQYSAAETDTFTSLQRSALEAESAANRTLCLLLIDRAEFADRKLGIPADEVSQRFLADGTEHRLTVGERPVSVRLFDAVTGLDISGRNPGRQLKQLQQESAESFIAALEDYVDSDGLLRDGGMEALHYRNAGIPVLPRNRPLQFREELLWIPGSSRFCPPDADGRAEQLRLIAPEKLKALSGRPNLYASTPETIAALCSLTEPETEAVAKALEDWRTHRTPIADTLPSGVAGKLELHFSTRESGVYTIRIDTASEEYPGCRLAVTLRPEISGRKIEYYQWFYF